MLLKPTLDFAFKRVFGNENKPEILIGFLNAVLECPEDDRITSVMIKNPNNDKPFSQERYSIMDIKAETNRKELVNIEIQVARDKSMIKRSLFYSGRMISGQPISGANYNKMYRVVCIVIMDYILEELKEEPFHSSCHLVSDQTGQTITQALELHYIQLPKIDSTNQSIEKEVWFDFLKNPDHYATYPVERGENHALSSAVTELTRLSANEMERELYYAREKELLDFQSRYYNAIEDGEERGHKRGLEKGLKEGLEQGREQGLEQGREQGLEQGLEQGREQGLEQGREEGREEGREQGREEGREQARQEVQLNVARNLLDVLDDETIALKTNLPVAEITALRKSSS